MSGVRYADIMRAADSLLGPVDDRASIHPEYTRAIVEMTATLVATGYSHAYPELVGDDAHKEAVAILLGVTLDPQVTDPGVTIPMPGKSAELRTMGKCGHAWYAQAGRSSQWHYCDEGEGHDGDPHKCGCGDTLPVATPRSRQWVPVRLVDIRVGDIVKADDYYDGEHYPVHEGTAAMDGRYSQNVILMTDGRRITNGPNVTWYRDISRG